ncbi:HPP family protein [Arenimonas sp.]|uniref:HPP family protein n=1 Tax=Arenimonas sp. TaxID=1872635 RepID=UPI0039E310E6
MTKPDSITTDNAVAPQTLRSRVRLWLRAFRAVQLPVDGRERWRAVAGALLGVAFAAWLSRWLGGNNAAAVWLVAPLGASAVLVFAVPASPLAQPWSVVGGNTLSALVGIACAQWIPDPAMAAAVAVAVAIAVMFQLRCLHPPGGAMALLAVLTHATHWSFAWFPAMTNSLLLVLAGMAYNTLTGRRYPHVQVVNRNQQQRTASRFSAADLDAVLARYNQVLDVSRDDLESILQATELQAYQRQLGELRCADIMSRQLIVANYATTLQEAWLLMRQHRIKALPVVDRHMRMLGIVTLADFMRYANIEGHGEIAARLRALLRPTTALHTDKPEVVGQIMTTQVRVASQERHVAELVPLFSEGGHHHVPIIGEHSRLVGIITQIGSGAGVVSCRGAVCCWLKCAVFTGCGQWSDSASDHWRTETQDLAACRCSSSRTTSASDRLRALSSRAR